MEDSAVILVVEDNEDDVFLMQRALKAAGIKNSVELAEDGRMAIEYLSGAGKFSDRTSYPVPKAVFLDLKLPIKDGFEVLSWIRAQPQFKKLPVVVLSSSNEPADFQKATKLGSDLYLVKPPKPAELIKAGELLEWDWLRYDV
jgi:CheY-like chemotaxis protein